MGCKACEVEEAQPVYTLALESADGLIRDDIRATFVPSIVALPLSLADGTAVATRRYVLMRVNEGAQIAFYREVL